MKKKVPILVYILFLLSCSPRTQNNIICKIDGLKNDSALIAFVQQSEREKEIVDTIIFKNGYASYNFSVSELYEAFIIPFDLIYKFENGKSYPLPASRINFYIDSLSNVKINGKIEDNCVIYEVIGNQLSEQLVIARNMKIPLYKERVLFESEYNLIGKNKIDEEEYWKLRKENNNKYQQQSINFIKKHPESEYTPRLLLEIQDKELVVELFNTLTKNSKESYFGSIIGEMIDGWMSTTPGLQFPNIVDKNLNGKTFQLSDLRGKYVILDFWGSWCSPCLSEIDKLKSLYENNKDKIEIVGIACNDDINRLKETISSNKINWEQLFEGQTDEKKYSVRFGIRNYPTKILLDTEGKIYKVYTGVDENLYDDINNLKN